MYIVGSGSEIPKNTVPEYKLRDVWISGIHQNYQYDVQTSILSFSYPSYLENGRLESVGEFECTEM